jgi:hypothetical protein
VETLGDVDGLRLKRLPDPPESDGRVFVNNYGSWNSAYVRDSRAGGSLRNLGSAGVEIGPCCHVNSWDLVVKTRCGSVRLH